MDLDAPLRSLYATDLAVAMRENALLFPWIEAVHVLGLTLMLGSIAVLDLRLIGAAWRDRPLARVLGDVLPVTWAAFAVSVVTGALMFASNAVAYAHNSCFQWKAALLLLIGLNTASFHLWVEPRLRAAPSGTAIPWPARLSGVLSIALWIGVTAFGRWIGFTINAIQ